MATRYFITAKAVDEPGKVLLDYTEDRAYAFHLFDQHATQRDLSIVELEQSGGVGVIARTEPEKAQ